MGLCVTLSKLGKFNYIKFTIIEWYCNLYRSNMSTQSNRILKSIQIFRGKIKFYLDIKSVFVQKKK